MNVNDERTQWAKFIERLRVLEDRIDDCEDALVLGNLNEAQDLLSAVSIEVVELGLWVTFRSGRLIGFIEDLADEVQVVTKERDALMEAENRRLGEIKNLEDEIALLQERISRNA